MGITEAQFLGKLRAANPESEVTKYVTRMTAANNDARILLMEVLNTGFFFHGTPGPHENHPLLKPLTDWCARDHNLRFGHDYPEDRENKKGPGF